MPAYEPYLTPKGLDDFTRGYLEAIEWLLDDKTRAEITAFAPTLIEEAKADCAAFLQSEADDLARYCELTGRDMSDAGVDFWLTRNRHGAGFWDRGNDPVFRRLTEASRPYGGRNAYAGDDRLLHLA